MDEYSDSRASLTAWHTVVKGGVWENFAELKNTFGSADMVGDRTVFNIANNRYRLVARVNYQTRKVFVLHILTHRDYEKGNWNK